MNVTKIEWTDATWNPLVGCTKVSAGCDHCYAETLVNRFAGKNNGFPNRFDIVTMRGEKMLTQPLRWRKPKRIFVNSLSDLFHKDVPTEFVVQVFAVMVAAERHTFQLLTKRPGRMRSLLQSNDFWRSVYLAALALGVDDPQDVSTIAPPHNVWLGVSVESQQWADVRIPALLDTPAAVRFLSCEPLLGSVDLPAAINKRPETAQLSLRVGGLDWVIAGGESGAGARPMRQDWARSLRDQCGAAGVPFLFKQWGEWVPTTHLSVGHIADPREVHGERVDDGIHPTIPWRRVYRRVGKKAAGRELDGRTWDEYPAVAS